jgi:hypothetical protein
MKDVFCNENYTLYYQQNLFLLVIKDLNLSFTERPKIKLSVLCFEDITSENWISSSPAYKPRRYKSKGKGLYGTGHEGPEGEERCSSTVSFMSALDGVGWSTPRSGRFAPGEETNVIEN